MSKGASPLWILGATGLLLSGCHTYRSDLDTICHVYERTGVKPEEGLSAVAPWLSEHIHTERARKLFRDLPAQGTLESFRAQLEHDVAEEGINPCPFIDLELRSHK